MIVTKRYTFIFLIIGLLSSFSLYASSAKFPLNTFKIIQHPNIVPLGGKKIVSVSEGLKVDSEGILSTNDTSTVYLTMEGEFYFAHETQKDFYFNLTWATTKLLIDDKEIVQVHSSQKQLPYTFGEGRHHVKIVVYNTDSPAAVVHIGMIDHQPAILSDVELSQKLHSLTAGKDTILNYVYHWQSKTITLKHSGKESILFLSAFKPATYTIQNVQNAKLKAIIYSGEGVQFKCDGDTEIIRVNRIPGASKLYPDLKECSSALGGLICPDETQFATLNAWIKNVAGKPLDGFNTLYKPEFPVIVPEIVLDGPMYQKIDSVQQQIQEKRNYLQQASSNPYYRYGDKKWSEILKIKENTIPKNKYRAYYIDKNTPEKIAYSEIVDTVSLTYSRDPFHNVLADNFMGLWIGDFKFDHNTTYSLNVALSWAKIKITDNGKTVYKGGDSTQINYTFTKGDHRIEIEYINNYGQVDLNIGFIKPVEQLNRDTVRSLFSPETKIYLFGSYESRRGDHGLDLFIKDSNVPTVLFLSSYETINYKIHNTKKGNLKTIIYNAYEPLGKVEADAEVTVLQDNRLPYVQRLIPFSYKPTTNFYEDKLAFPSAIGYIQNLTGIKPQGFSSIEAPSLSEKRLERLDENKMVLIPQILLDDAMYLKIEDRLRYLDTH